MRTNRKTADSVFRIATALSLADAKPHKRLRESLRTDSELRLYLLIVVLPLGLSIALALFGGWLKVYWLKPVSLASLGISYLGILIHPLVAIALNRAAIRRFLLNPLGILVENAKQGLDRSEPYVRHLFRFQIYDLRRILVELRAERAAFEKRLALAVGTIEKIGVLPGLLAYLVLLARVEKLHESDLVQALAYAVPFLYLFGAYMHVLMSRLDRYIALFEFVIATKEEDSGHP